MFRKPDFLTDYEFDVLKLANQKLTSTEIGKKLDKEPGSVRKTKMKALNKIETELKKAAKILRLDTSQEQRSTKYNIPKAAGLLRGHDWVNDTDVYLIISGGSIIAWYVHECSNNCKQECHSTLTTIRSERQIKIPPSIEKKPILQQFHYIMDYIIGEFKNERK